MEIKMLLACSIPFIVSLLIGIEAAGVGKAWEISPVQNLDHDAPLLPRPRLESSAFEVRSISGVGRLAPPEPLSLPFEREHKTDVSSEDSEEPDLESTTPSREARELEDLNDSKVYISEVLIHDPMIDGFFRKTKEVEDVEALPSLWRKFRRHGRTGRNHGHCSEVEEIDESITEQPVQRTEEESETMEKEIEAVDKVVETMDKEETKSEDTETKPRVRREAETELEKIVTSKNLREARLNSPESWSNQPLVEFRHQTKLEKAGEEEQQMSRSTDRGLQAPHTDFVTANRRSFTKTRESRDLPLAATARSYDTGMPIYRNTLRDRDLDAPYSRGLFYPERYRTERDYFVRGLNDPSYPQDRYHEVDLDRYGRSRSPPKQKRIIYYATLPEVVRKPVDLRSYPRPYDPLTRSSNTAMSQDDYYKRRAATVEPGRYRYYSYPYGSNYENYDLYAKRPSWNERPYDSYGQRMKVAHRREQDMDHASMKDASRPEESMLELGHDRKMPDRMKPSREQDQLLWPVKIGTELTVKDTERISGRKIFGQQDDYNRFRNNARMDRDRESADSVESRD